MLVRVRNEYDLFRVRVLHGDRYDPRIARSGTGGTGIRDLPANLLKLREIERQLK